MDVLSEARSHLIQCILVPTDKKDILNIILQILENSVDFQERYYCVDCGKFLRDNASVSISNLVQAVKILEKYGKNLLRPDRPPQWKIVRWSNPVFQKYVSNIKGSKLILERMGYLNPIFDGASFPPSVEVPDKEIVALVTSDVALLKYELLLFQKNQHPNPNVISHCLNYKSMQPSTSKQQLHIVEQSTSSSNSQLTPIAPIDNLCSLCGNKSDFYCPTCNKKQCNDCDKKWHLRSDRSYHQRTPLKSTVSNATETIIDNSSVSGGNSKDVSSFSDFEKNTNNQLSATGFGFDSNNSNGKSEMPSYVFNPSAQPVLSCASSSISAIDSSLPWDEKFQVVKTLLSSTTNDSEQKTIFSEFCQDLETQIEKYDNTQQLNHLPSVKQHFLERSLSFQKQKQELIDFFTSLNTSHDNNDKKEDDKVGFNSNFRLLTAETDETEMRLNNVGFESKLSPMPTLASKKDNKFVQQPSKEQQAYSDNFFGLDNRDNLNKAPKEKNVLLADLKNQQKPNIEGGHSNGVQNLMGNQVPMSQENPISTNVLPPHRTNSVIETDRLLPTGGSPVIENVPSTQPLLAEALPSNLHIEKQLIHESLKIAALKTIDKIRSAEAEDLTPLEIQLSVENVHEISNESGSKSKLRQTILDLQQDCSLVSYSEAVKLFFHHNKNDQLTKQSIQDRHMQRLSLVSQPKLYTNKEIVECVKHCNGDINKALIQIQKPFMQGFTNRLKNVSLSPYKFLVKTIQKIIDSDHLKSIVVTIFDIKDITIAEMMCLIVHYKFDSNDKWCDLKDALKEYHVQDVFEAAKSFPDDIDMALKYLSNKCSLCFELFPQNKVDCMTACGDNGCAYCQTCLTRYLTMIIREGHIRDLVCPVCKLPDVDGEDDTAVTHFTYLDVVIKKYLDEQTYSVYLKKLTDRTLMKMANFRWCSHCENGFVYEGDQNRLKMLCPNCKKATCFSCKKRWEVQHEGISCQAFLEWKQLNDENFQAEGLAAHLKENGINCPYCNFRYALAKGGCMHFKCVMCSYQFCSGCKNPFRLGQFCSAYKNCSSLGLHAHHPRDCLFYLRDLEVDCLQKILSDAEISFGTEAKHHHNYCQVLEQKETSDGLEDAVCGREVLENNADLCTLHYKEYLVNLINDKQLDPAVVFTISELEICLKRSDCSFFTRAAHESDDDYKSKLLNEVKALPLIHQKKVNPREETCPSNSQSHTFLSVNYE